MKLTRKQKIFVANKIHRPDFFERRQAIKECAGHYFKNTDSFGYVQFTAISPNEAVGNFSIFTDEPNDEKAMRMCAKLWAKGKCSIAEKIGLFLVDNSFYYEKALLEELSGIITKKHADLLNNYRKLLKKAKLLK